MAVNKGEIGVSRAVIVSTSDVRKGLQKVDDLELEVGK